jgi:hypothetical protein
MEDQPEEETHTPEVTQTEFLREETPPEPTALIINPLREEYQQSREKYSLVADVRLLLGRRSVPFLSTERTVPTTCCCTIATIISAACGTTCAGS